MPARLKKARLRAWYYKQTPRCAPRTDGYLHIRGTGAGRYIVNSVSHHIQKHLIAIRSECVVVREQALLFAPYEIYVRVRTQPMSGAPRYIFGKSAREKYALICNIYIVNKNSRSVKRIFVFLSASNKYS